MCSPKVSIIIPSWNGKELLRYFLPSVLSLSYPRYEVIVVDNASTDGTAEFLAKEFPTVRLIRNPRNDGTAEGSNAGARAADGDLLFFLSNDMWIEPDALDRLVSLLMSDVSVGVVTLKMRRITPAGERLMVIDSVGGEVDSFGFPRACGIHQPDKGQFDRVREVFFSFGGALLIRKELFSQVGGYDSAFFTLADDIDLCWRVRLLGHRVVADPGAVLYHRVSATLDSSAFPRAQRRFLSERNTQRMLLKNYSLPSLCEILPLMFFLLAGEAAFFAAGAHWQLALAGARALAWNAKYLKDTLALRRRVQACRLVPDAEIRKRMLPGSEKLRALRSYMSRNRPPEWEGYFGGKS